MKELKVLILTSKFPRFKGDAQPPFTYDLARHLLKKKCIVHVIAPHAKGAKKYEKLDGIFTHRFSYFWPSGYQRLAYGPGIPANIRTSWIARFQIPFFLFSEIFFSRKVIREINPDIIHINWAVPQGIAAVFLKKPFIMTVYGGEVFLSKNFHIIPLFNYLIKRARKTFAITDGLRNIMHEYGLKGKIGVIPLGIDIGKFNPHVQGSKELKEKICRNNEKMVLCVGRLVEKKGIHYLLPAFANLLKKMPNTRLVIVGDGYMYGALTDQARTLGIGPYVTFTKEVNHESLPKYYRAADLFVLPSIIDKTGNRETQGVVYLEAMACKCPVIGTRTGGIPNVITDDVTGVLVGQKDARALTEAMARLLSDGKVCKRYAENAYKKVMSEFTWDRIAESYFMEYKKVIQNENR